MSVVLAPLELATAQVLHSAYDHHLRRAHNQLEAVLGRNMPLADKGRVNRAPALADQGSSLVGRVAVDMQENADRVAGTEAEGDGDW